MNVELEAIKYLSREELTQTAEGLDGAELGGLVETLASKDDGKRYGAFLLLLEYSEGWNGLYAYWDLFVEKMRNLNSYQRNIGLALLARNAKWDKQNKINGCINLYLELCDDEKPVTVRQCIQNIKYILPYHIDLWEPVIQKLLSVDISIRKETQRKLLYQDIEAAFKVIATEKPDSRMEAYLADNRKWAQNR